MTTIIRPKSITWVRKPLPEMIDKEYDDILWLEEAKNPIDNHLIFKLYYQRSTLEIILEDMQRNVKYVFPADVDIKSKAYTLAFKLLVID